MGFGRTGPLYLWGPGKSNFTYTDPDNNKRGPFNDGMSEIASALEAFTLWHTESQSFAITNYADYILNQLGIKPNVAPRLAVGTHFQATDDTIKQALQNIRLWYPKGDVVIASDFMVVTLSKKKMDVRRGVVSAYAWPQAVASPYKSPIHPKYWIYDANQPTGWNGDPTAQLDPTQNGQVIPKDLYNAR